MAVNLVQLPDGSRFDKNEIDGKTMARAGGVPLANAVSATASAAGTHSYRGTIWAFMPLLATAGVGAALASFQNKEAGDIFVTDFIIDIQTASAASCTFSVGIGALATSSSSILFSAMDLSSVTVVSAGEDGSGKKRAKVTADQYVNMIMVSGSATGLVGRAAIGYIVA